MKIYDGKTLIGKGFDIYDTKKERLVDIFLEDSNRAGHLGVLGATRIGKSRLVEAMAEQDIIKGHSLVIIDPKGDWELFARIYDASRRAGREKELFFLSPFYPDISTKFNIMSSYALEDELINHIVAGMPVGGDQFYHMVGLDVTSALVRSKLLLRKAQNNRNPLSLKEIMASASYSGLESLLEAVSFVQESYDGLKESAEINLKQLLEAPQDNFSKVARSLTSMLSQITQGNMAKIIATDHSNVFIDRIERNERAILYVQTGSLLTRQTSSTLARIIISSIQALSGRLYARDRKLSTPLVVYADEFSNVAYMGIEDLFNKAGGANIWITALTQNFADIIAEVGPERADKIVGNWNSKLVMRLGDQKSSYATSQMGNTVMDYSAVLGLGNILNARELEMPLIKPTEALELKKREYLYFGFEGTFRGKTPPVKPLNIRFKLPEIRPI